MTLTTSMRTHGEDRPFWLVMVVVTAAAFIAANLFNVMRNGTGDDAASKPGFQGLPWGATAAQIKARFGAQVRDHQCDEHGIALDKHSRQRLCGAPEIARYEVGGIPFTAKFALDHATGGMIQVRLESTQIGAIAPDGMSDAALAIKELLTQRYGKPMPKGDAFAWFPEESLVLLFSHPNSVVVTYDPARTTPSPNPESRKL